MSRRSRFALVIAMVVTTAAACWLGAGWIWRQLLALHGRH
jgi:hypothetical protein